MKEIIHTKGEEIMKVVPYINEIDKYLIADDVIDYENKSVKQLAEELYQNTKNELEYIQKAYEYVRDNISHSADRKEDRITCTASEVLREGHGICFAKSHLLAALLRCKSIPTGLCYQKLTFGEKSAPMLVYHGLNGVYVREYQKWIRLDARGNTNEINAQFSIETERLAYQIHPEIGEIDDFVVYPKADVKVLEKLKRNKTRTELWKDLPTELAYNIY